MRTRLVNVLVVAALLVPSLVAQETGVVRLTVEEAIERALASDAALRAAAADSAALAATAAAARARRLPELDLTASYARVAEQDGAEIDIPGGSVSIGDTVDDVTAAELLLRQPVYLGGRIGAQVERSEAAERAARLHQERRHSETVLAVQRAYWALREAELRRDAYVERLDQVEANLATMSDRFDQGVVTRAEVLAVEMRLAAAELDVVEADNRRAIAEARLAVRIGEPAGRRITPTSPLPSRDGPLPPLVTVIDDGLARRADLAAYRELVGAAEAAVTVERAALLPEIFVTGSYRYARPNEAAFPPQDSFEDSWRIGISGHLAVGGMPAATHRISAAAARVSRATAELAAAREAVGLEIRSAYLEWETAGRRIHLGETMVRQTQEHLANTRARLEAGAVLNEELLDAQVDVLEARLALSAATIGRELAWLELSTAAALENGR